MSPKHHLLALILSLPALPLAGSHATDCGGSSGPYSHCGHYCGNPEDPIHDAMDQFMDDVIQSLEEQGKGCDSCGPLPGLEYRCRGNFTGTVTLTPDPLMPNCWTICSRDLVLACKPCTAHLPLPPF